MIYNSQIPNPPNPNLPRRLEEALKMLLAMKEAGLKPDEAHLRV